MYLFLDNIIYIIDFIYMYIIDIDQEKFDGVVVNNEVYVVIKCFSDLNQRIIYLDCFQEIYDGVQKQCYGWLLMYFFVSWYWGQCNG